MVKITFPDDSIREYEKGVTGLQTTESISPALTRNVVSRGVNGEAVELNGPINEDATIALYRFRDEGGRHTSWHSSAHLLVEALKELCPGIQFSFSPAAENGFFYDIQTADGTPISENDFPKIERKMMELARKNQLTVRREPSKADAVSEFTADEQTYKVEHIVEDLEGRNISTCTQGNFADLCRGPHSMSTGLIEAVKIASVAGALWRGDTENTQLTRVYDITFPKKKMLDEYLLILEETKKCNHREIGKKMELFVFSDRMDEGMPTWLPKGAKLHLRLQEMLRKIQKRFDYQEVITPCVGSKNLYITSGHCTHYGKDSFQPIHTPKDGEEYMLKPINCPHHCEVFACKPRSYKNLPLRITELDTVHRYERSDELHELTRIRSFTQDDAHIFCHPDQVKNEFLRVMGIIQAVFTIFNFDNFEAQISLRDPNDKEKYIDSDKVWTGSEQAITEACKGEDLGAKVAYGEVTFYGPKLDFMMKDAIGERWQLGTIRADYNLPQRFKLGYTTEDNTRQTPVMVHRAPFGSLEQSTAVLIEHTAGHFPLWLTPEQMAILPISRKLNRYAQQVVKHLAEQDIWATIDDRNEKVGRKIRDNELKRVPYMTVVREKEATEGLVSMRKQDDGEQATIKMGDFTARIGNGVSEMFGATNIHPED